MNWRIGAILATLSIVALVGGDYILSSQVKGALEVEVTERTTTVHLDGRVDVEVEVVITNNHNIAAKLSGATLTTYIGGHRVGSETIKSITIEGNSETTLIFNPKENWSEVPVLEPSMTPMFDFEVKAKAFFIENTLEETALIATNINEPLAETPVETPSESPPETPSEDSVPEEETNEPESDEALLARFLDNVLSGGPPKDGIPPIDEPSYVSVQTADEALGDDDVVFILESSDPVKIYPQYILVFHEIVNEELDGEPISITYCPLTGSTICYKGDIQTAETTFGTSGKLLNSNLVMYDRATDSYWPQILGTAINGPLIGESLDTVPLSWTRWGLAKAQYPEAQILSQSTGYLRNYGSDPYGSYTEDATYYQTGSPFFPVMNVDGRLPPKEVVVAIKAAGTQLAVRKSSVADDSVINLDLLGTPLVAIYDEALEVVRVFRSEVKGEILTFRLLGGSIIDGSGSTWNAAGQAVEGTMDGESLTPINHFDVMWFAWSAFYPDTEIIQ